MNEISLQEIKQWYATGKEKSLSGRWLPFSRIKPLLGELSVDFEISQIGLSINKTPIHKIQMGRGSVKVLIWTQMHGNESTGTKALFDLFNLFKETSDESSVQNKILSQCTITCIPMLNPDGAEAYTRVNAADVDLNRDAVDLKSPESQLLRAVIEEVKPDYCFNLHDQRTIFTVGDTLEPATLSFLAPSVDVSRKITQGRKETMRVIVAMNQIAQQLIEAGHAKDDYLRDEVRYYNFVALLSGLSYLSEDVVYSHETYFEIPNNTKNYLDIIYRNIFIEGELATIDVGVLFKEKLINDKVVFNPEIEVVGDLSGYGANEIIDNEGFKVSDRSSLKKIIKK